MAASNQQVRRILERILDGGSPDEAVARLQPRLPRDNPLPPRIAGATDFSAEALQKRRDLLAEQGISLEQLSGYGTETPPEELAGHTENLIGFARVPVGVIGPLRVNGTSAIGDFYVPLATTEGALVASYQRGAHVVSRAGGAVVCCMTEAVARAPCFVFDSVRDVGTFLASVVPRFEELQKVAAGTSNHCQLMEMETCILGKEIFLIFEFTTGDAAGQNMVTIATEAVCQVILEGSPVKPRHWFLDGNLSGDKKATMVAFIYARGKKVVAEATIGRKLIRRFIHTDPEQMVRYWQISVLGGIQSGSIGVQGHFANALAALFISCGQDVACVSEAAVGVTRMDVTDDGDLYVSVSLPNLIVGTVGGGTQLPTARECLAMMGCAGSGRARKFAEICCATALAGEISIIGSMAAGDFAQAHARYGRQTK